MLYVQALHLRVSCPAMCLKGRRLPQVEVQAAGSVEVDSERLARLQTFHAALLSAKLFSGAARRPVCKR